MAHKKAKYNNIQKQAQNEALNHVDLFCKRQGLMIDPESLRVAWFAFLNEGYMCQITSFKKKDVMFEVKVNKCTGEVICSAYYRMAYSVKPSTTGEVVDMRSELELI